MSVNNVYKKLRLFFNFCVIFGWGEISHCFNDTIYETHLFFHSPSKGKRDFHSMICDLDMKYLMLLPKGVVEASH